MKPCARFIAPQLLPRLSIVIITPTSLVFARSTSTSSSSSPNPFPRDTSSAPASSSPPRPWRTLNPGQKVVRSAQQSLNLGVIIIGTTLTGIVGYYLVTEVFSPGSTAVHFNQAVGLIRRDPRCVALLCGPALTSPPDDLLTWVKDQVLGRPGTGGEIEAWQGEPGRGRHGAGNRRTVHNLSAEREIDAATGVENERFLFRVRGSKNEGVVGVHLVRGGPKQDVEGKKEAGGGWHYKHLYLDVPGHSRIWLEGGTTRAAQVGRGFKFLGFNWGGGAANSGTVR